LAVGKGKEDRPYPEKRVIRLISRIGRLSLTFDGFLEVC